MCSVPPVPSRESFKKIIKEIYEEFSGPVTQELISSAKELLLNQCLEFRVVDVRGSIGNFKIEIESKIGNAKDLADFVSNYIQTNNETIRVSKTKKLTSKSKYSIINYYIIITTPDAKQRGM